MILILGVTSFKSVAQKPTIDLLPAAKNKVHPEAKIDTFVTPNTLFLFESPSPKQETEDGVNSDSIKNGEAETAFRRRNLKMVTLTWPGLHPWFIKNLNPLSFIIRFTALKF
jgi:hypothetical protein